MSRDDDLIEVELRDRQIGDRPERESRSISSSGQAHRHQRRGRAHLRLGFAVGVAIAMTLNGIVIATALFTTLGLVIPALIEGALLPAAIFQLWASAALSMVRIAPGREIAALGGTLAGIALLVLIGVIWLEARGVMQILAAGAFVGLVFAIPAIFGMLSAR